MGIFSRKTHVSVASSIWNLAGDIAKRPHVLKETVFAASMMEKPIAPALTSAYLKGAGVRLRNFGSWANDNFSDVVGLASGSLVSGNSIVMSTLADELPVTPGYTVKMQSADIDYADFTYWADQYVAENYPDRLGTLYTVDMNETLNQITIIWEDTTTTTFTPTDFDPNAKYLYSAYYETIPSSSSAVDTGTTVVLGDLDDFPSTVGWDVVSSTTIPHTETLTETITVDITYSDATPPSSSSSSSSTSESYDEVHEVFEQYVTLSSGGTTSSLVRFEKSTMYQDTVGTVTTTTDVNVVTEDIGGGVIKTTTTTTETEVLTVERSYRIDTQEIVVSGVSPLKIHIYKYGDGNSVLDAMFEAPDDQGSFMPFIPFRLNNLDVKDSFPDIYPDCAKAFKKATGGKYDKVRENIIYDGAGDINSFLADVDYCYAVFGVSLNTVDRSARRYLYRFFKLFADNPSVQSSADYDSWVTAWNAADASMTAWLDWRAAATASESWSWTSSNPEPTVIPYPTMPKNSLKIGSTNPTMNYHMTLAWNFASEDVLAVAVPAGRKVGDYWFSIGTSVNFEEQVTTPVYGGDDGTAWSTYSARDNSLDVVYLHWQETATQQRRLTLVGLTHNNLIWGNKSVFTKSKEALQDLVTKENAWLAAKVIDPHSLATKTAKIALDEVEESGFIIPMHQDVYKDTGLLHGTQTATACCYLVFNCYKAKKEKWYQTSFFRALLIVVAVVITVISFGADGGATLGSVLASAVTTNGALQLVLAFAINMVVATVLLKVMTWAATKLFGEEIGRVIGAIASVLVYGGLNNMAGGKGFVINFGDMMKITNLMKLTAVGGNAYADYMNESTTDLQKQTEALVKEQEQKMDEIAKLSKELFGSGGVLDPKEVAKILSSPLEQAESFLQRTLMTGSDLANMSLTMLNDFAEITLSTELPTS